MSPGSTCIISGTFKPSSTGPASILPKYSYKEGADITLKTSTVAIASQTKAIVNHHFKEKLPVVISSQDERPKEIAIVYENNGDKDTGALKLKTTENFIVDNTNCDSLKAGESCTITGQYKPENLKDGDIVTVIAQLSDEQGNTYDAVTKSLVGDVALSGNIITALPEKYVNRISTCCKL